MPYLLRAINRENWPEPDDEASVKDLDADALNDLKTQDNTLSMWYADSKEELGIAIVAYLASMDKWVELESIDFIVVDLFDIKNLGINVIEVPNFTYIEEYKEKHRDLAELKYDSIEQIADVIIKSLNERNEKILDKGEIRNLFEEVVRAGKLRSCDIQKGNHKKLKRLLIEIEEELDKNKEMP